MVPATGMEGMVLRDRSRYAQSCLTVSIGCLIKPVDMENLCHFLAKLDAVILRYYAMNQCAQCILKKNPKNSLVLWYISVKNLAGSLCAQIMVSKCGWQHILASYFCVQIRFQYLRLFVTVIVPHYIIFNQIRAHFLSMAKEGLSQWGMMLHL